MKSFVWCAVLLCVVLPYVFVCQAAQPSPFDMVSSTDGLPCIGPFCPRKRIQKRQQTQAPQSQSTQEAEEKEDSEPVAEPHGFQPVHPVVWLVGAGVVAMVAGGLVQFRRKELSL